MDEIWIAIMVNFPKKIWKKKFFILGYLDRYKLIDDNRVLIINSVDLNDNARYTCIGTNIAGELSNHIDLQIFSMINFIIIFFSNLFV
jgi:hypothetical protein